jgi:hypothetical protein
MPMDDEKNEKRELTMADIEPAKMMPVRERRELLSAFLKRRSITIAEFGRLANISELLLYRFEHDERNLSVEDWARALTAMGEIEKEKSAERKARFDELQKQWMKTWLNFTNPFMGVERPTIEAEQQRIIEEDGSSLELSKLIVEQWSKVQKEVEAQIAQMSQEEIVKQYGELWASAEAKDRRIAELEKQLEAYREQELRRARGETSG